MTIEEVAKSMEGASLEVLWTMLVAEGFSEKEVEAFFEARMIDG